MDSLAATGSRFQRQIRTERVRQHAGNRARAATGGSAGGPMRGHSKSLSTSSINSIGSVGSNYSIQPADARRRPPPLIMAGGAPPGDNRNRSSLESYRSNAESQFSSYRPPSPGDFTPTSATFSTAQSSPRWSGITSPSGSHSRTQSMYTIGEARTPGRRLSVPSAANPYQQQGPGMFGHSQTPSNGGDGYSANGSLVSSPTTSTAGWSRRESISSVTDEAWRRRTWHPDSRNYQFNPSVTQPEAPNPPPPVVGPPQVQQSNLRLPGIDSLINRPTTPPQRIASPMQVDSEPPPRRMHHQGMDVAPPAPPALSPQDDRRNNLNMYDVGLQRGLNRLDLRHATPPREPVGAWASEVNQAVQAASHDPYRAGGPSVRFEEPPPSHYNAGGPPMGGRSFHQQTMSAPSIAPSNRRHGWQQGPAPVRQPAAAARDPRAARVHQMVHPNFDAFNGFPGREQPPPQQQQPPHQHHQQSPPTSDRRPGNGPMGGLDALVAAATGESSTAKAY